MRIWITRGLVVVPATNPVSPGDGDCVGAAEALGEGLGDGTRLGLGDGEGLAEGLGDGLGDGLGLALGLADGLGLGDGDGPADGLGDGLGLVAADALGAADADGDGAGVIAGVGNVVGFDSGWTGKVNVGRVPPAHAATTAPRSSDATIVGRDVRLTGMAGGPRLRPRTRVWRIGIAILPDRAVADGIGPQAA